MRKFLLSAFVVASFLFYAEHKHLEASQNAKVEGQSSLKVSSLSSVVPLPTDSGSSSPSPSQVASNTPAPSPPPASALPKPTPAPKPASPYKDGQFTGDSADAYYGNIQVAVTISGGKITDVVFLDHPKDRKTSVEINSRAMPYLKQEAIVAQSANVNTVSGATDSSRAFIKSLQSALGKARG